MGGPAHPQLPGDRAVRVLHHLRGVQLPDHEPRRERERGAIPDPCHMVSWSTAASSLSLCVCVLLLALTVLTG